ncbi:hypothetical protein R5R70_04695 [Lactiplantibacillus plantarum]|uniref:hypothetical protein n=1 Tax=Lactiplantibacillus plantarum TaxID=1590 RepID=UPI00298CB9D1|nr:hypothetical protein [Lactiplantibacillus plantarum]WPB53067.1 hypothetical protein R5R70_04695 [Lactiplantibacillus plantarum]
MKMQRRIKRSVYYSALIIISIIVVIMVWRANLTGTVIINSVDENGTPLIAAKKIIAPVNTVRHIKATKVSGYTPESKVINASFSTTGNSYNVVYQPNKDDSFQHLVNANYVGVSSQDVTTNSLKSIQAVPFGNTMNRLRVVYGRNGHDWKTLNVNYPNLEIQDPSITKYGQYWFITYTGGVLRTADFMSWQSFKQPAAKKYGQLQSPSLIHNPKNKLSMVFTTSHGHGKHKSYVAPFNYVSAMPDLKKAHHLKGLDDASSVSIYGNHDKYYALYTTEKNAGTIYISTTNKLTGRFKKVKKIRPASGTYYYAPSFILNQNAKAVGITYSSYYYDESNNLSYSRAFYQNNIMGKNKAVQIKGQFVFQKVSAIQIK